MNGQVEVSLSTPGLLFPAISLLMLAYTNRFLALASLIRSLHARLHDARQRDAPEAGLRQQIDALRFRVMLIRNMQSLGILALLVDVAAMFGLYIGQTTLGQWIFGCSLLLLMVSLCFSLWEIQLSTNALNLQLADLESDNEAPIAPSSDESE